jgi:DNA-binding HxlR family transcriptional regulator
LQEQLGKATLKLESITGTRKARWYDDACGTALALELVGERWALLIVREMAYGPRRFSALKAMLPGISANVLTQRLEGLEAAGIVVRRKLPEPANVQVYDLTDWGREAAPILQMMGRWAARSPRHDKFAFMSPASAVMSLETLVVSERLAGLSMTVALRFPSDAFVIRIADGALHARRGETDDADVTFSGDTMAMRMTVYGKAPLTPDGAGGTLAFAGDRAAAERFVGLFALPDTIAG